MLFKSPMWVFFFSVAHFFVTFCLAESEGCLHIVYSHRGKHTHTHFHATFSFERWVYGLIPALCLLRSAWHLAEGLVANILLCWLMTITVWNSNFTVCVRLRHTSLNAPRDCELAVCIHLAQPSLSHSVIGLIRAQDCFLIWLTTLLCHP